ncbi:hypothetical protein [Mucilaginibacter sp. BT774]|uniref:hypothetical protein n=1 Tax=Mucilaginibacter sp. BT774 TaxID=3062276 RepID=UPI0026761088|nr:hypothetical protein [Mucilaginibacter sp. BT774]MDO3625033.1 hypothetical protein [Mucilaginibacter sp. BT774]
MSWTVIVLIICCLLAAFAVWKEVGRPKKVHLALRIIASILAAAAFACIILPISYDREIYVSDDHAAVLLTPGFNPDSLNNDKRDQLFTTDKSVQKSYPQAKLIRLDELNTDSPAFSKVHLFGYGLNNEELTQLNHLPVVFHPLSVPSGISQVNWNQKLKSGERLTVQGSYNNTGSKTVKLILRGLSTQLDTAIIPAKSNKQFELTTVPKSEGRVVYHLLTITGTDTLENENLPVEIDPVQPLKILILSASPDFETKFLKNWLAEHGYEVAVRSTISKDKFSSEYANMQAVKLEHLNAGMLEQFDVVIGDLSVLKTEGALKSEVTQKGLGVIIRADTLSKGSSWLQTNFPREKLPVKNLSPVALSIRGRKNRSAPLKTEQTFIREMTATQSLVSDAQNHSVVSSSMAGSGHLVFTAVANSYNWMLAGDKDDYAAFWSLLIKNAARKVPVSESWSVAEFPTVSEPIDLQLQSGQIPGKIIADSAVIAPVQNPDVPFEWSNKYWPITTGWHSIKQNNGQPQWYYVYGRYDWEPAKAAEKLAATRHYTETYPANSSVTKQIHEKMRIEVPKIYFYLLLLVACVYLWAEGKLIN